MTDITLPWPPRCLWPNSRVDRRAISGIRKAYRQDAGKATWAAGFRQLPWESAHVSVTFCPPDQRARDLDNMLAAIKAGLDGIADVIRVDDSRWSLTIRRGPVVPHGAVRVALVAPVAEAKFDGNSGA